MSTAPTEHTHPHLVANLAALQAAGTVLSDLKSAPDVRYDMSSGGALLLGTPVAGRFVRMHSAHDPVREATLHLDAAYDRAQPPTTLLVVGLGLGYLVDALELRNETPRLIVIEPVAQAVLPCLARRDFRWWIQSGKLRLLVGPDYRGAGDAWRGLEAGDPPPPVIVNPVLEREWHGLVRKGRDLAARIVFGAQANDEARRKFAGPYLLNTLSNLAVIGGSGDVGALFNAFPRTAGIIVAAGPSLDGTLPALRTASSQALVIAVDTALRPLLTAGIHPHITVAVDPGEENARHLRDLPAQPRHTYLVAEGSLAPSAFPAFADRVFTFRVSDHQPWPWLHRQGVSRQSLRAWGSVATSALDLAIKAGCDPVVFVGQDLAITGGRPYCSHTTFETDWATSVASGMSLPDLWARILASRTPVVVPDVHGVPTVTTPALVSVRDWLLERCTQQPDRRFVNATGAGILSGVGVTQGSLLDVVASCTGDVDIQGILDRACQRSRFRGRPVDESARALLSPHAGAPAAIVLREWVEFAGGTVTAADVQSALQGRDRTSGRRGDADALVPDWLVAAVRHLARTSVGSPDPHARAALARWPDVTAVVERVALVRAAFWDQPPPEWALGAERAVHSANGARMLGASLSAVRRLLSAVRIAHGAAPGIGPEAIGPQRGWVLATALFAWDAERQSDVDEFERWMCAGLERPETPPLEDASGFHDVPIADDDADQTTESASAQTRSGFDDLARHALALTWISLWRHLAAHLGTGPARRPPAWLLETRWPAPVTGAKAALTIGDDEGAVERAELPLAIEPWRMMRSLTGVVVNPSVTDDVPGDGLRVAAGSCELHGRGTTSVYLDILPPTATEPPADPRVRVLTSRPLLTLRPEVLTERGLPRTLRCVPISEGEVLVTPPHAHASFRVAEDSSFAAECDIELRMVGELPSGRGDERVVWGHVPHPYVALREPGQSVHSVEQVPFVPFRPVVTADGTVLWATDSGLWEWTPGRGGRRLADLPSCFGIRLTGSDCRLDPRRVGATGQPIRRRDDTAWIWRAATGRIDAVSLDMRGPRWFDTYARGWSVETYPYADVVEITSPAGRRFHLACFYPVQAAWAGTTLVVTSRSGDVLAFRHLTTELLRHDGPDDWPHRRVGS